MEFNSAHLDSAFRYNDQSYYITREPKMVGKGDKFIVWHKNEAGYRYVGGYYFSEVHRGRLDCYSNLVPDNVEHWVLLDTMEDCRITILSNHKEWLDKQFEKAFSSEE